MRTAGVVAVVVAIVVNAVLCVSLQATPQNVELATLFAHASTFGEFLRRAQAQREVWLRNASRTDIPPDAVRRLAAVRHGLRVLIVAEDWCVDSAYTVPYVANLAAAAYVDVRIVDRVAGASLMSAHRAADGRLVTPVVVLVRNDRDVAAWIERPAALQQLFFAMGSDPEAAREFANRAVWYEHDRGRTTIAAFVTLAEQSGIR